MSDGPPVLRVGLTGGIASGKTTVAAMLGECGARIVDADRLAHQAMEPGGAAFAEVVARFGPEIVEPGGGIDRVRLGRLVFADASAREALNRIVHPHVRAAADRIFRAPRGDDGSRIAVLDAALLVETGAYRNLDRLIVVRCSRRTQIERLLLRDGLSRAEAESRIAAQAPVEQKLAVADYVVDTDTSLDETRRQTQRVYAALVADHRRRFGGGCGPRIRPTDEERG